jgi:alkylated DNA repair dioxygenase AlkB
MKSLYSFIIEPKANRYDNIRKVNDNELIINTNIEDHSFVSKKAVVVETPAAYKTKIEKGDEIYVHHNIFRRYYDMKGNEKNSSMYFKDNLYFAYPEQIYMYNKKCHLEYCFVAPIKKINGFEAVKEQEHFGILKYSNSSLERLGLKPGALVVFTPDSEFEFIIDGERLYCMKSNDIAITNEYEGNEKEYNPSWA